MSCYFRIFVITLAFFVLGTPLILQADVNISVGIVAPPPVILPSPPSVLLIPGTYAYFVPDLKVDILFYQGYWYRTHGGYWYLATHYNGPWSHVIISRVPRVLIDLPSGFHDMPRTDQRISYRQLKSYWKKWEDEGHWDKQGAEKHTYKKAHREHRENAEGKGRKKY